MLHYFYRNKLHLSLLSALAAASWSAYFDIPINRWAIISVFFLTFSIYQDNRLTDDIEDAINDPESLVNAVRNEVLIIYVVYYLISIVSLVIAFLYRRLDGARRLKDLYIVKNLTPPLDWATALVFLPLFYNGRPLSLKAWICWGYVFVSAFFIEVMWDMRDRRGDLVSGIRTIGNSFTFRQTKRLLITLSIITGVLIVWFTFGKILPASSYFLLLNNVAVMIIASLYREEQEQFMRKISDLTIVLATVLFLSFGLVAFYSK
ncbi:MAG: UbiA family prenyltransferase [Chlorobiales bacterium]|nr:UbiA family prenyltransferase [Chlorobiales bacterium]